MKGSITKRISLALAAVFAVGALSLCGCAKNEKSGTFDETNIVLSFSAMSDIHQQKGKTQYADKLVRALDYAEELNGGPLDVALFAGDLTEETWRQNNDGYSTEYNADVAMLKETLERSLNLEETAVFYALGNHDTDPSRLGVEHMGGMAELFYRQLGEKFFWVDAADSEPEIGRRHAVVNGYHFLSVQPDEYWTLRGYSDETLSWIDAQLKTPNNTFSWRRIRPYTARYSAPIWETGPTSTYRTSWKNTRRSFISAGIFTTFCRRRRRSVKTGLLRQSTAAASNILPG